MVLLITVAFVVVLVVCSVVVIVVYFFVDFVFIFCFYCCFFFCCYSRFFVVIVLIRFCYHILLMLLFLLFLLLSCYEWTHVIKARTQPQGTTQHCDSLSLQPLIGDTEALCSKSPNLIFMPLSPYLLLFFDLFTGVLSSIVTSRQRLLLHPSFCLFMTLKKIHTRFMTGSFIIKFPALPTGLKP